MPFPVITKEILLNKLRKVGVQPGDLVYVASFMPILGNRPGLLDETIDALLEAVGQEGTIVMPAFNWDYCKGDVYDPSQTPSQVGVLTEAFRKRPGALRSLTPPWCTFVALGKEAVCISNIKGTSAFGSDGIVQYLYDKNCRYILLGCPYDDAVIHVHWLEEMVEVPYRYWKQFKGKVRLGGEIQNNVSYMYARRLDLDTSIDTTPLANRFEEKGKVVIQEIGLGKLRSFMVQDYVSFIRPYFEKDKLVVLNDEARKYFI